MEAAEAGHQRAQAAALSLANALGINLPSGARQVAEEHLHRDVEHGSKSTIWDRGLLASELYESSQSICMRPTFIGTYGVLDAFDAFDSSARRPSNEFSDSNEARQDTAINNVHDQSLVSQHSWGV